MLLNSFSKDSQKSGRWDSGERPELAQVDDAVANRQCRHREDALGHTVCWDAGANLQMGREYVCFRPAHGREPVPLAVSREHQNGGGRIKALRIFCCLAGPDLCTLSLRAHCSHCGPTVRPREGLEAVVGGRGPHQPRGFGVCARRPACSFVCRLLRDGASSSRPAPRRRLAGSACQVSGVAITYLPDTRCFHSFIYCYVPPFLCRRQQHVNFTPFSNALGYPTNNSRKQICIDTLRQSSQVTTQI